MKLQMYKVGGAVRDEILGIKSKDIDYAVEVSGTDSVENALDFMREEIRNRGGEIYLDTPEYFTIRANVPGIGAADFVLCRKDGVYTDGRRPDSVSVGTIFDDLARRDFTMNAIAISEEGEVIDPFFGKLDIARREIRCVGNTESRMSEDRLRILRALRFKVTKGFSLSDSLSDFLNRCDQFCLEGVSADRVRDEMERMCRTNSHATLDLLLIRFRPIGHAVFEKVSFRPTMEADYRPRP